MDIICYTMQIVPSTDTWCVRAYVANRYSSDVQRAQYIIRVRVVDFHNGLHATLDERFLWVRRWFFHLIYTNKYTHTRLYIYIHIYKHGRVLYAVENDVESETHRASRDRRGEMKI